MTVPLSGVLADPLPSFLIFEISPRVDHTETILTPRESGLEKTGQGNK